MRICKNTERIARMLTLFLTGSGEVVFSDALLLNLTGAYTHA
jgi:hypothetical protein